MDPKVLKGLTEAYSAVYDEDLRDELEEMMDEFSGIENLTDEEIDAIVEETIDEMLEEGFQFDEVEEIFEEVLSEARVDMAARAAARKQYAAASEKSAKEARGRAASKERSEKRAAAVSKVKGAVKSALGKAKAAVKSGVAKAKEAGKSAKFNAVDKPVAAYATKRNLHPAAGMAARSKDPEKRRGLRAKVAADIKGRLKKKVAQAQVGAYGAARKVGQAASDVAGKAKQSAKNAVTRTARNVKGAVGKTARAVASGAGKVASRLGEDVDAYDVILSHLLDEGYAESVESAEKIMVNMSEEWREEIVEAYVDYRKGKLPSGRTPQQKLTNKLERTKVAASREQRDGGSFGPTATPSWKRSKKSGAVGDEMDANTSFGGKVNKVVNLGRRDNAGPSVQRGEPNTARHQQAIDAREKAKKS